LAGDMRAPFGSARNCSSGLVSAGYGGSWISKSET
jgi:hypothetical protein